MDIQSLLKKKSMIGTTSALLLTLLAPCVFSTNALANSQHFGGGFNGPGPAITSLKDATKMPDDSWATLRGKIVRHVGGEIYIFEDASGQGKIEIDDDIWRGLHVNKDDVVEIIVEIDKEWNHVKLEAEQIRKIQ